MFFNFPVHLPSNPAIILAVQLLKMSTVKVEFN